MKIPFKVGDKLVGECPCGCMNGIKQVEVISTVEREGFGFSINLREIQSGKIWAGMYAKHWKGFKPIETKPFTDQEMEDIFV